MKKNKSKNYPSKCGKINIFFFKNLTLDDINIPKRSLSANFIILYKDLTKILNCEKTTYNLRVNQNFFKKSNNWSKYVKLRNKISKFYPEGYVFNIEKHLNLFWQHLIRFDKAVPILKTFT